VFLVPAGRPSTDGWRETGVAAFGATRHDLSRPRCIVRKSGTRLWSAMAAWSGGLTRLSGNQANGAKSRCRDIFRRRRAHPLRSSRRPRLGQKRRNAGCRGTGARPGMSLLSADLLVRPHAPHDQTTRRRQRRCFHRPPDLVRGRPIAGTGRVIFLIADRGPAPIARKTRAFVESLNGSPRLFHLPPYFHPIAIPVSWCGSI
jgi:hypothetical protein